MRPPPPDRREKGEDFGNGRKALPLFLPILAPNQSGIGAGKKCIPLVFWRLKSQTYFLCFPDLTIRETRRRETQCFDSRQKRRVSVEMEERGDFRSKNNPFSSFFLSSVCLLWRSQRTIRGGEGKRGNSF